MRLQNVRLTSFEFTVCMYCDLDLPGPINNLSTLNPAIVCARSSCLFCVSYRRPQQVLDMMARVHVPRFDILLSDRSLDHCISLAMEALGYQKATSEQMEAIKNFVLGRDVFVSLPTGSGKSLCYAALPCVFDNIRGHNRLAMEELKHSSIVVCVSPLSACTYTKSSDEV